MIKQHRGKSDRQFAAKCSTATPERLPLSNKSRTQNQTLYHCLAPLAAAMLAGLPLLAHAMDVNFPDGSYPPLAPSPYWKTANSLFPGTSLTGNTVTVTDGTITGDVYGGVQDGAQEISGNKVIIDGAAVIVSGDVLGGASNNGVVTGNSVTISNGSMNKYVIGGSSYANNTTYNNVAINGGSVLRVYGGYNFSKTGNATNNSVTMSGGSVTEDVYGGFTGSGSADNNSVTISGGSIGSGTLYGYVYGGRSNNGNANNNSVDISDGLINLDVYGGFNSSGTGSATDNSVTISGESEARTVYGGRSNSSSASNNSVTISGESSVGNIYGGQTPSGDASSNNITIYGGTIRAYVYGGQTSSGNTTGNKVAISSGSVSRFIYGGHSFGNATDNSVAISGDATVGNTIGGSSNSGIAIGNNVTVSGGAVTGYIYGGYADNKGSATDNSVIISDGSIGSDVYGGLTTGESATGNSVAISGGSVGGSIVGGSSSGITTSNSVTISDGSISGYVYGGLGSGLSTNNSVTISGGSVGKAVIGGRSTNSSATNNSVTISGTPQFGATSALYGGYTASGDAFTGNVLTFSAAPITVNTVANFEQYNFTIDPNLANKLDTALITAQGITLGSSTDTPSTVTVVGIHSGPALKVNDTFVLMKAENEITGNGVGETKTGIVQQGISLQYDVRTDIDLDNKQVTATILGNGAIDNRDVDNHDVYNGDVDNDSGPARVNPQLKALSEGWLSGLMLVTRGADAIANDLNATIVKQNRYGLVPFVMLTAGSNRYNSGSHIQSNDTLLAGGLSYRQTDYTIAAFVESGWGNYDSYNSFTNAASVHGDGNTHYVGGGLFGRYEFGSGVYAEASLRAGQSRNKFDTADIHNPTTGSNASNYNLKSTYISAHAGAGYLWTLSDTNTFDVSAKYLWSRVGGKNAIINSDSFHFDSINSQRLRINGEFSHRYSDSLTLFAGLGYEYEFNAKAKATTYDVYQIDAPTLKGSTGILSLGATFTPSANRNLSFDIGAQGYVGKREGGSVAVRVSYAF